MLIISHICVGDITVDILKELLISNLYHIDKRPEVSLYLCILPKPAANLSNFFVKSFVPTIQVLFCTSFPRHVSTMHVIELSVSLRFLLSFLFLLHPKPKCITCGKTRIPLLPGPTTYRWPPTSDSCSSHPQHVFPVSTATLLGSVQQETLSYSFQY